MASSERKLLFPSVILTLCPMKTEAQAIALALRLSALLLLTLEPQATFYEAQISEIQTT